MMKRKKYYILQYHGVNRFYFKDLRTLKIFVAQRDIDPYDEEYSFVAEKFSKIIEEYDDFCTLVDDIALSNKEQRYLKMVRGELKHKSKKYINRVKHVYELTKLKHARKLYKQLKKDAKDIDSLCIQTIINKPHDVDEYLESVEIVNMIDRGEV